MNISEKLNLDYCNTEAIGNEIKRHECLCAENIKKIW